MASNEGGNARVRGGRGVLQILCGEVRGRRCDAGRPSVVLRRSCDAPDTRGGPGGEGLERTCAPECRVADLAWAEVECVMVTRVHLDCGSTHTLTCFYSACKGVTCLDQISTPNGECRRPAGDQSAQ